ncbi:metal ABC transporter solute-binding protein, Zn/Mn family [Lysinibacillus pakistanensis]|uniref:Zinc ABC transporter substrate-binding protein n=1 Tax=Lysinibacillus pakistanensis TaxID=759811 RepID=A0AAX3WV58_9BACI|nr:zinc ABC transporter substrate-binding protein [Lysinibacillus pakistanensis]MDM5230007.1 zinc ABC transporter substrate-binding protein [Lysinibacillus pakistanensis]WHY45605.1 zinc ABC transporter substrate-binding protein [Lysinibacillus pakistanensis]WHY50613.1 zinc ABC transporter substrate-binding protein [Lysinibacillus pakistanensis]
MKKALLLFLVTVLALFTAACGDKSSTTFPKQSESKEKMTIYTTVYPLSYFTQRIGGDFVEVSSIYPAGANEHTFEPTQKDMMKLADADLFFYVGLGLEGFVENAKKTLAKEDVTMIATADHVSDEKLAISTGHTHADEEDHDHAVTEEEHSHSEDEHEHDDHDHGNVDPHVWLSPIISQDLALSIKDTLIEKMPEQEATFTANYEALVKELQELDQSFKAMAEKAPEKTFFVSHAAFGYIAGQYGLTQMPIAGLNSQNEPSQKELTAIVDKANDLHIHYILFEQNVSSKLAEVIQKEVGAKSLVLHNLSILTADDVKNKETYFTLMDKNIQTLKTALSTEK